MTAIDIIIKRTGMDQEDAKFYESMAISRVRTYLNVDDEVDLSSYMFAIADIAVLYWQKDQSIQQTKWSLGYGRESFEEGSVRHTIATMTGSAIYSTYDGAINDVLASLDGMDGAVMFL